MGNDVCVNLTRAPSTVARPAGTHCESRVEDEEGAFGWCMEGGFGSVCVCGRGGGLQERGNE